jgi:hypothetical protein
MAETGRKQATPSSVETNLATSIGRINRTNPPCTARQSAGSDRKVIKLGGTT